VVPLAAGLVVLVRFPFSDLSQIKPRPAVVLANAGRGDWILCQVTSKPYADPAAVVLKDPDFERGSLPARGRCSKILQLWMEAGKAKGS
jgi:mRNA interferase MazF